MDKQILRAYGIDADRGVGNCMNDASFYERLLSMFLQDGSFQRGKAAYASRNRPTRRWIARSRGLKRHTRAPVRVFV